MPTTLTSPARKVKNHVVRNRAKYAYVAGFASAVVPTTKLDRVGQFNDFLEEKGLLDEFYRPEDI